MEEDADLLTGNIIGAAMRFIEVVKKIGNSADF